MPRTLNLMSTKIVCFETVICLFPYTLFADFGDIACKTQNLLYGTPNAIQCVWQPFYHYAHHRPENKHFLQNFALEEAHLIAVIKGAVENLAFP